MSYHEMKVVPLHGPKSLQVGSKNAIPSRIQNRYNQEVGFEQRVYGEGRCSPNMSSMSRVSLRCSLKLMLNTSHILLALSSISNLS